MDLKNSKTRFRSVFDIFIISAANGMDTNQRTFFVDEKKNGNVKSLTQSYFRSPCLPGRMKLSGSGTEATMFSQFASSWWPSLVLLMFWTDFLSFGEMFDLVYFNYCPSFLFFPISLERCKTKENINTSWLSIRWSPHGGMT